MGIDCCMNNCVNFFSDIFIRGAGCGVGCWHRRFGCFGGVSGVGLAGLAPLWGLVLGMLITFRCNTIFFFLCVCVCGHQGPPPSGKNAVGISFKKKMYIFLKFKIIKTQVFDVEIEGICVMVHNKHH